MAFSQGSSTSLSFITESTYGTTPAGNFTNIPFNTHTLNLQKQRVQGNEIQSDRMPRNDRHGYRTVSGDIVVDFRADVYDTLLESLMFSTWDTSPSSAPDELKVGTTLKSFSIEDYASDIDQARLFTGMAVNSASFSIQPNQMIQTTFNFMGNNMSLSGTQKTVDAAALNQPHDSYSGAVGIADNGSSTSEIAIVSGIDFTITNSLNPAFVIGTDIAPCLEYGRCEVEGTMTVYFEDESIMNRFINETETALDVSVNDPTAGNEYKFFFPRAKINTADAPVENPQSRFITCSFVALYDSTEGSNVVIYRPETA